jgi:DNA-binding CsgD family transcriptional regulator/PAS domain-containing protein
MLKGLIQSSHSARSGDAGPSTRDSPCDRGAINAADASAFLQEIAVFTGTAGLVATRHVRNKSGSNIIGACGSWISNETATAIADATSMAVEARSHGDETAFDSVSWPINGIRCPLIRIAVLTGHADVSLMLTILLNPAESTTVTEIEKLGPLIASHFELWQHSRDQAVEASAVRSAMEAIDTGILLINGTGKIIFGNRAATELLDGDHLRRSGDGFTAIDLQDSLAVNVALSHSIAANRAVCADVPVRRSAPILTVGSRTSSEKLLLWFVPAELRADDPRDCATVVYLLHPGSESSKQLEPVCRLHGLSPVETRLVCHITAGKSLQEAASAMRVKEQTARGYLKQAFAKTGTNRQAELVRTMLSSLMRMRGSIDPVVLAIR